jgi:AAA domain
MSTFRVYDFEPDDDAQVKPKFKPTRFGDVSFDLSAPYLIKGLIPSGGLTVVWGPPKCGKSFWTFDAMMHVARDMRYRGRRVQQGSVVYVALEGGRGFCRRIEAYKRHHRVDDAPFYLITDRTDLVSDHKVLIDDIKEQTPDRPIVVVIDTLNRSLAGSESSDEDMTAYIKAADAVREALGCGVIVVHHCGVDGSRPRGHTSLTGAADAQIAVSRNEATDDILATVEWMKDGDEDATIVSRLEVVELGNDADGEPMTSCVVVPTDAAKAEATTIKLEGKAKLALEALYEAITDCGEVVPSGHIPPKTRTTTVVRWTEYFESKTIDDRTKPDSKRRAFVRSSEKLQTLKIIGVWKDRVWIAGHAGQART